MSRRKVGIVGTGNVGVASAFALVVERACDELILVDLNKERAHGEALDLMHGQGLIGRMEIRSGGYEELADCHVIVISAGVAQREGETRLDLLSRNAAVFRSIAHDLDHQAPDAILVVASNPVDVLTYMLQQLSRRTNERIIGTGTMLDTSRFRTLLGDYYEVNPQSVHGYILAEHGDSEFAAWSTVTIGGSSIRNNTVLGKPFDVEALDAIFEAVRGAAYEIIRGKGYTNWAIGLVIAELVKTILEDRKSILPVSVRLDGEYGLADVCVSVPSRVGSDGIEDVVELDLTADEQASLIKSASVMKESIAGVDLSPAPE